MQADGRLLWDTRRARGSHNKGAAAARNRLHPTALGARPRRAGAQRLLRRLRATSTPAGISTGEAVSSGWPSPERTMAAPQSFAPGYEGPMGGVRVTPP